MSFAGRRPAAWIFVLLTASAVLGSCRPKVPQITSTYVDTFTRAEIGPAWNDTGGGYKIVDGVVHVKGAYNHPLWLRHRLPANALIEVDVTSHSSVGDAKVEIYGDGESFDPDKAGYIATGYVLIFGGWGNALSIIARKNEHNEGVKASRSDIKVVPGQTYRFSITRKNGLIDWKIDGKPFLTFDDPEPLSGRGHEFFGFNNWESDVRYDNLSIRPLE